MDYRLPSLSGSESSTQSTGEKDKKKKWRLLRKSQNSYRLIWAPSIAELELEVTRFMRTRDNVILTGPPFRDIGWFQAAIYSESN